MDICCCFTRVVRHTLVSSMAYNGSRGWHRRGRPIVVSSQRHPASGFLYQVASVHLAPPPLPPIFDPLRYGEFHSRAGLSTVLCPLVASGTRTQGTGLFGPWRVKGPAHTMFSE